MIVDGAAKLKAAGDGALACWPKLVLRPPNGGNDKLCEFAGLSFDSVGFVDCEKGPDDCPKAKLFEACCVLVDVVELLAPHEGAGKL